MLGLAMVLTVLASLLVPCIVRADTLSNPSNKAREAELLQTVEANLLSLFGFRTRPRPDRRNIVIPDAMLELYRKQTGNNLDSSTLPLPGKLTKTANTVRSFTHVESDVDATFPSSDRFRLAFDIASIPRGETLQAAELQLSRSPVGTPERRRLQQVLVHDIIRPGVRGRRDPIFRLIDSKVVDVREEGTVSLDVLPAVQRWLENPRHNHGLVVEVAAVRGDDKTLDNHVRLRRSADEESSTWLPKQPLLMMYTDDGKNVRRDDATVRSKRAISAPSSRKHKRKDSRENCRRHALYVDFNDVGWNDWIVAPPGYDAFYCHGDCPFPLSDHLNSTNHAIVQTLMNSVSPSTVPKACCVPTALTSISMLYLDEQEKVVLKNYQEMAVLGCGCR